MGSERANKPVLERVGLEGERHACRGQGRCPIGEVACAGWGMCGLPGRAARRGRRGDEQGRQGRRGAANRPPPEIACALATCLFGHAMRWAPPPNFGMFSLSSLRQNLTSSFSWTPSVAPCNRLLYIIPGHTSCSRPVIPSPRLLGLTRRKLHRI